MTTTTMTTTTMTTTMTTTTTMVVVVVVVVLMMTTTTTTTMMIRCTHSSLGNCTKLHLHLQLSHNRASCWGTTGDFTTTFLHFSLFSIALWDLYCTNIFHIFQTDQCNGTMHSPVTSKTHKQAVKVLLKQNQNSNAFCPEYL